MPLGWSAGTFIFAGMVLLSHPTGNTFVRALLEGLLNAKQLGLFATTLGFSGAVPGAALVPEPVRAELFRRSYSLPGEKMKTRPWLECCRLLAQRLGAHQAIRHERGWASVDAVYRDLDRHVAAKLPRWSKELRLTRAYAYEDAALETFKSAKREGLKCFYDLPIAYWKTSRRLLDEEAVRRPEWKKTLVGTDDSSEKLERKTAEIEYADAVVCPSRFVLNSLPGRIRDSKACLVAEFGTPRVHRGSATHRSPRQGKKLRVLFAGSMTQRKGLADLFDAMKLLQRSDVELVVLGSPVAEMSFYRSQYSDFTYEPPRPHSGVLDLMSTCDVLCLPSIVEGRALVQQEAMSCGLPLIVTENAGGDDLVVEGETGFLAPIRNPVALATLINRVAENRDNLIGMRQAARSRAANLTWERYSAKIMSFLNEISIN